MTCVAGSADQRDGRNTQSGSLQVKEGDFIKQGQVLAVFDNRPQIQADLASTDERIRSVDIEIPCVAVRLLAMHRQREKVRQR